MRNLEQRLAEINRRSEEILKARRQRRKYIATACIPVVLCIALFSAFILPTMRDRNAEAVPENDGNSAITGSNSGATNYVWSVKVVGTGISRNYRTAEEISGIVRTINSLTAVPEMGEDVLGGIGTDANMTFPAGTPEEKEEYEIVFSLSNGTTKTYYLSEAVLTDRKAGKEYLLTEAQYAQLKAVLGVS